MAVEVVATEAAIIAASARPCQMVRDATLELDMSWSPLQVSRPRMIRPATSTTITEFAWRRKCRLALDSIASRYVRLDAFSIRRGYRTDCATAFLIRRRPLSDGVAPDWRAFPSSLEE